MSDIVDIPLVKMNKIFPNKKGVDKSKLMITNVGMYSVSKIKGSEKLIYLIKKYFNNSTNLTITDATSNVGSDSINLAMHFKQVNSIELDFNQFSVLKHNVEIYGLQNVNLINGNSLETISTLKQDVVYIDAPWGGIDYKNAESMKLYLGDNELSQIYMENKQYCKLMIFKVPKNYDFTYFIQHTDINKFCIHSYLGFDGSIKFYFIMCIE